MEIYTYAIVVHVVGAVIGVGTVTLHDLNLLRSIGNKDLAIAFLKSTAFYGRLIQTGLFLLLLSGFFMMFSRPVFWNSEKILTKLGLVVLLMINGLIITFVLSKKLKKIKAEDWSSKSTVLKSALKIRLPFDAISFSGWYSVLILGAVGRQSWPYGWIILGYFVFLIIVLLIFQTVMTIKLRKVTMSGHPVGHEKPDRKINSSVMVR